MKNALFIIFVVLSVMSATSATRAGGHEFERFYDNYVTGKIADCERAKKTVELEIQSIARSREAEEISIAYPTGADACLLNMRRYAKMRDLQAKYYEEHRKQLVAEMVARDFGTDTNELEHFMSVSFFEAMNSIKK